MDAVAAVLGLAKGTLYRYFPTREALLLGLLTDELEDWFDALDRDLPSSRSDRAVVRVVARAALSRPRLMRLLAVLPAVLECNVPFETAYTFKAALIVRLTRTGADLDWALGARSGSGLRILTLLNAGVIGLYGAAHPATVMQLVLDEPAFAELRVDLAAELTHLIAALVAAAPRKKTS